VPGNTDPRASHPFAEETGFLVQWAHQKMRAAMNEALRPLGFNTRHLAVLAALSTAGPLTQRAMIDLLDIDKSVLVYVLNELEQRGFIERHRPDHDRRTHVVDLTADGRDQLAAVGAAAGPVNERLLQPLSPTDRRRLNDLLWRIILGEPTRG
jgi:DNA-binding MarR family transcriptional regulator